jgi:hypothetical protein
VTSVVSLFVLLVPSALVDSFLYGRPVIAGLNIVLYNVLSEATSSELCVMPLPCFRRCFVFLFLQLCPN